MSGLLITFMREAKKDIRRMPEELIFSLSNFIGEIFTWVAHGELDENGNPVEMNFDDDTLQFVEDITEEAELLASVDR